VKLFLYCNNTVEDTRLLKN